MEKYMVFEVAENGDKVLLSECKSEEEAMGFVEDNKVISVERVTDIGTEILFSRGG